MSTKQKLIYAALALSLAVNMVLIGAAGSYAMKWRAISQDANWVEKRLDRAEESIIRHLDGPDEELAKRVFKQRRPELLAAIGDLRGARKDFRTVLTSDTADAKAIAAALNRSQAAAQKLNENMHGALRDMALGLSPSARQKIADRMKRRMHDR
ncbi:MAG: periplasmic heavy metal sensor [Alphaproteobacteria bacterium]|nr:periplasmic heavy metal sensor [Alphaproteobacteria bacterium]